MSDKLKIQIIKTDSVCFISDCYATCGYDYNYHQSKIKDLYFDGKKPSATYYLNWFQIKKYPILIERDVSGERINERYEIKDDEMISKKLPKIILNEEVNGYSSDVLESFYSYKSDRLPDTKESVDVELDLILEIENYKASPIIDYNAICKKNWSTEPYKIKNIDVNHQMIDKIIFPSIMLHSRPCFFSSKQMYDITRQYVKDNIDNSKAKITSDYDFCFTVKKIIPLLEPETISYQNIFAKTKKERSNIKYVTKQYKEVEIFQMTHDQERYKGYTAIEPLYGESEDDLKYKVDLWLSELVAKINQPLELCPHCKGSGYFDEI